MKKKVLQGFGVLISCIFFVLSGCSNTNNVDKDSKEESTSNKVASVEIENGNYIIPEGETVTEDEGYLALNVKIKNIGKDTLNISLDEINLYDDNDNKVSQEDVYTDDKNFKRLNYESISGGKSTNGYIVFKVNRDKKYELHYDPISYTDEKKESLTLNVDTKKYKDNSSEVTKLTEEFVNTVFLNKKNEAKSSDLENNLEEEHSSFNKLFSQTLAKDFSYYKPSDAELMTAIEAFEDVNGKKAKIKYSIKSFYPEKAIVYVKAETIHFASLDTEDIATDFVNKNQGKYTDYDKAQTDGEKYILEQLPSKYESASVSASDTSSGEGYEVHLNKKDGKWSIDTSDSNDNYMFKYLKQAFMGDLFF